MLFLTALATSSHNDRLKTETLQAPTGLQNGHEKGLEIYTPNIQDALEHIRALHGVVPQQTLLDRLPWLKQALIEAKNAISNFFHQLFGHLSNALPNLDLGKIPGLSDNASRIVSLTIGVLLCFILLLGLFMVLRWYKRHMEDRQHIRLRPLNKPFGETLLVTSAHHWQEAQRYANRQDFEAAVRELYYAVLCRLDESKTIPFDESLSNFEFERLLLEITRQENATLSADTNDLFKSLARRFELVRYGHYPAEKEMFALGEKEYESLSRLLAHSLHESGEMPVKTRRVM
ncbi:MAG: hypothetical protein VKJ04_08615 [Vampirovibrionales bacterium]|nr:hypothetical protein [Vampirovibrionales bacterium]